jgi:hypothetical protein
MILKCPHCFNNVLISENKTCPSCNKNVDDTIGLNKDITSVNIKHNQSLPKICMLCGQLSEKVHKVEFDKEVPDSKADFIQILQLLGGSISTMFSLKNGKSKQVEISLELPFCKACYKLKNTYGPKHVDFENYSVTYIANKEFIKKLKEM